MIRKRYTTLFWFLGLALMSTAIGCSNSTREPVSGTVTLDGKPLAYGIIHFSPQGHAAASSGGMVEDGKFEIPGDKGLQPGSYAVEIQAFKKTGRMVRDFPSDPERPEQRSVQINEAGQLKATIDVGNKDALEFHVTTKLN